MENGIKTALALIVGRLDEHDRIAMRSRAVLEAQDALIQALLRRAARDPRTRQELLDSLDRWFQDLRKAEISGQTMVDRAELDDIGREELLSQISAYRKAIGG